MTTRATNATVDIKLLSNINIAKTELATGYILNAANATANLNHQTTYWFMAIKTIYQYVIIKSI